MEEIELPPLPITPHGVTIFGPGGPESVAAYISLQMRAYALEAVRADREARQQVVYRSDLPAAAIRAQGR